MRKFLLFILFVVLAIAAVYKSPFSALINYNKAKSLYDSKQYSSAIPYFEKSLFADKNGVLARFYYVLSLSKAEPTLSNQKKLYKMSISTREDEAQKFAKTQVRALKYELLSGFNDTYIYNAVQGNDVLRWDLRSFPLKVYIDKSGNIPEYYEQAIKKAMGIWVKSTNFVKFQYIENPGDADILISFKNNETKCDNGVCSYVVAYTEPIIESSNRLKQMQLNFYKTNPMNKSYSYDEIYNTAVHEVGHTLGIMGHSDKPNDVMFSMKTDFYKSGNSDDLSFSMRDLKTLVLLYRIEPTITDTIGSQGDNLYYSKIILGEDDILLEKKLAEFQDYINCYPDMVAGYINLSGVYADMGNFESALKVLDRGEPFARANDEKFLVNINRAINYFNLQKYDESLKYANIAKSFKSDKSVDSLLEDLAKFSK